MGVNVNDIKSEKMVAKTTVNPNCLKNCPTIPDIKAIGVKTTTFVIAAAITATAISEVPFSAANLGDSPRSIRRAMFSNTTIEFATSIPMESPKAISVITFKVNPAK